MKAAILALLAATICGIAKSAPTEAPLPQDNPANRSERSTLLAARKFQMFIKHRHLQLLPDGTVNGTTDDASIYTILQRTTVGIGQMKIQGVATCQYLCMDACGLLYSSREFEDECIFNETIEQHHYNTYSSSKYSNDRRTLYLGLNRRGQPRKVAVKARHQLGRLSSYTRVLTRPLTPEREEELRGHRMRHNGHSCASQSAHQDHQPHSTGDTPRCRKRKKRKKKKRKCEGGEEADAAQCQKRQNHRAQPKASAQQKCNDENGGSDECQRDIKRRLLKSSVSEKPAVSVQKKKRKNKKGAKRRLEAEGGEISTTAAPVTATAPPEDATHEEDDYGMESSTHNDWEEATAPPDISMAVSDANSNTHHSDDSD